LFVHVGAMSLISPSFVKIVGSIGTWRLNVCAEVQLYIYIGGRNPIAGYDPWFQLCITIHP